MEHMREGPLPGIVLNPHPAHVRKALRRLLPLRQTPAWLLAPGRSQAQTHQGGTGGPDTLQHLTHEHRAQERLWEAGRARCRPEKVLLELCLHSSAKVHF